MTSAGPLHSFHCAYTDSILKPNIKSMHAFTANEDPACIGTSARYYCSSCYQHQKTQHKDWFITLLHAQARWCSTSPHSFLSSVSCCCRAFPLRCLACVLTPAADDAVCLEGDNNIKPAPRCAELLASCWNPRHVLALQRHPGSL